MKYFAYVFAIVIFSSGCAYAPHNANISIDKPAASSKIGAQGTKLHLQVIDDRDETDLGRRGAGIAAAKVKADGFIPKFISAVENGFRAKGYELTQDSTAANAELIVALRALKFEESMGFWTVGAEADATITADAERGGKDYRRKYRASDEDRQFAISFAEGIDAQLSQVLNEVMGQLFNDAQLDEFLTSQ